MELLFIIGMPKSGTSLLNRLLMEQSFICNPFLPEGKFFWGDIPPFSPTEKPCGVLYQKYMGNHGHYLDEKDFSKADQALLNKRIIDANISKPILMNKNAKNSVRIRWLKAIFPKCKIVTIYRKPLPNIYSLLKKYSCHNIHSNKPEDGWWGVKPKNWRSILTSDKLVQCSNQWNSVNQEIIKNKKYIDAFINYSSLCDDPNNILRKIASLFDININNTQIYNIKNMNNEYAFGSRLLSKNVEMRKNNTFNLNNLTEKIEFPPFSSKEISTINNLTKNVWGSLHNF